MWCVLCLKISGQNWPHLQQLRWSLSEMDVSHLPPLSQKEEKKNKMHFLQRGEATRGFRPKLNLGGRLACSLTVVPAHFWTQMEIHLLPVPSWLVFLFCSHRTFLTPPPPPLSRACLPAEALYLTVRLSDSLSFSCGHRPPSAAVTANRNAEGPFQTVI